MNPRSNNLDQLKETPDDAARVAASLGPLLAAVTARRNQRRVEKVAGIFTLLIAGLLVAWAGLNLNAVNSRDRRLKDTSVAPAFAPGLAQHAAPRLPVETPAFRISTKANSVLTVATSFGGLARVPRHELARVEKIPAAALFTRIDDQALLAITGPCFELVRDGGGARLVSLCPDAVMIH